MKCAGSTISLLLEADQGSNGHTREGHSLVVRTCIVSARGASFKRVTVLGNVVKAQGEISITY